MSAAALSRAREAEPLRAGRQGTPAPSINRKVARTLLCSRSFDVRMQANYTRTVHVFEVATDCVLNHRAQLCDGVGLRENGMAQGLRFEPTLG